MAMKDEYFFINLLKAGIQRSWKIQRHDSNIHKYIDNNEGFHIFRKQNLGPTHMPPREANIA